MALFNTRIAHIFDEKGDKFGKKRFSKKARKFNYADGTYNVDLKNSSYWEKTNFPGLWKERIYYYNLGDPNPYNMGLNHAPVINPQLYKIHLDTKVAVDLNNSHKGKLSELLTLKNIVIGVIVIAVIYLIGSGKLHL